MENELLAEIGKTKDRRSGKPVFKLFESFLAAIQVGRLKGLKPVANIGVHWNPLDVF